MQHLGGIDVVCIDAPLLHAVCYAFPVIFVDEEVFVGDKARAVDGVFDKALDGECLARGR